MIRRAGYVDQAGEEIAIAEQGERLVNAIGQAGDAVELADVKQMVTDLTPMRRLTTTFRFNPGGSSLERILCQMLNSWRSGLNAAILMGVN